MAARVTLVVCAVLLALYVAVFPPRRPQPPESFWLVFLPSAAALAVAQRAVYRSLGHRLYVSAILLLGGVLLTVASLFIACGISSGCTK